MGKVSIVCVLSVHTVGVFCVDWNSIIQYGTCFLCVCVCVFVFVFVLMCVCIYYVCRVLVRNCVQ